MLPEASQSGRLTLYRATDFPLAWQEVGSRQAQPALAGPGPGSPAQPRQAVLCAEAARPAPKGSLPCL